MGAGLAQVGALLALTVIGLPLLFFGLLAALDRFEQMLSREPRTAAAGPAVRAAVEQPSAAVVTLPVATAAAAASANATSSALSPSTSKPAAAV